MAIFQRRPDPMDSMAASLGSAAGSGAGNMLQMLTGQMNQQQQRSQNTPLLQELGYGQEQAQDLSQADPRLLLGLMNMMKGQQQAQAKMEKQGLKLGAHSVNKQMKRIMANKSSPGISRKIKEYLGAGKGVPANLKRQLKNRGFTNKDLQVMTSSKEVTPEIEDYFMKIANGDEYKAANLARKYGFDVPVER